MKDNVKSRENQEKSDRRVSNEQRIVWNLPIGKQALFPDSRAEKYLRKQEDFYENRSYEKQKTTDVYYNAKDPLAEVYTHDTNLKKRLRKYAAKYPELCKQTDDDGQGGLRFEIDKSRISIRLTAPYSDDRRKAASELAKKRGIHTK